MAKRELKRKHSAKSSKKRDKLSYKTLSRMFRVFGYLYKRYWKMMLVTYAGLLLTVLVALLLPWPLKLILDHVIINIPLPLEALFITEYSGSGPLSLLMALVAVYVVLYLADSLFSYIYRYGLLTVGEKMVADIRYRIFGHLQRLSMSFHDSSTSGDLVYRLTFDINHIRVVLVELPNILVYRLITVIAHLVLMAFLEWRLALISVSIIPLLYYYNQRFGANVERATPQKAQKRKPRQ